MKAFRTAILGCGHFARKHAARLAELDQVSLVAFCDSTPENAQAYNQEFAHGQAQVLSDYEQLFSQLGLDLVYICLPPYAHGNEVELACRYGVNMLIEKPIALSLELARTMQRNVRQSGVKCQVGFMYRFGKAALWLKEYLQRGSPEERSFMTARYACNSLHSWWWRDRAKSGGQLVEQVIHILDLTRFFLGEPVKVFSMQDNMFHTDVDGYSVEDSSATAIRFASGSMATIAATNGAIPNRWEYDWRFFSRGLTADFSDANHAVFHHTSEKEIQQTVLAAEDDLYLAETLDLLEAIREGRDPAVPVEEGVLSLQLALAAAQAASQDAPVTLEPPHADGAHPESP